MQFTKTATILATFSVMASSQASAQDHDQPRTYHIADIREYGTKGRAESQATLNRRSEIAPNGERVHRFSVNGAFAADNMVGLLTKERGETPIALVTVPADRSTMVINGYGLPQVTAAVSAASANPSIPPSCKERSETVTLPVPDAGLASNSLPVTLTVNPKDGKCVISWRARSVRASGAKGDTLHFDAEGVTITNSDFELLASTLAFSATPESENRFVGKRAIFLLGEEESLKHATAALSLQTPLNIGLIKRSPALTAENVQANFTALQTASLAGLVETAALGYAEERSNPLPLLAGIATFYAFDTLSATIVNGLGGAATIAGLATGNQRLAEVGDKLLGYNGIIGSGIVAGATALGGERAGEIAGLGYNAFTTFTPRGISAAYGKGMTEAVGKHVLLRGGTEGFGNLAIRLAGQADTANRGLQIGQFGASTLDQLIDWYVDYQNDSPLGQQLALDMMGNQTGSRLSPTPSPNGSMSDLAFQQYNQNLANPRSPFPLTTTGDYAESSAGFADVVIANPLSFRLFDSGNLEDGDIVSLRAFSGGRNFIETVTLTFAGRVFTPAFEGGLATINITALNVGSAPPNTGGLAVLGPIVSGRSAQNYNLNAGETGTLRVFVAGRRAR